MSGSNVDEEYDDELVDGVAGAIHQRQVMQARAVVARRNVDTSYLPELFKRLLRETETARVHIFFSYLDDQIRERIVDNLQHLDGSGAEDRLFGPNGPLSTFHSRVLMAYHLGWLSPGLKRRLDSLRKIRNEFGHAAYRITSADPSISAQWRRLDRDFTTILAKAREIAARRSPSIPIFTVHDMPEDRRQICQLAFLAHDAILELLVSPVANGYHVSRRDVIGEREEKSPEPIAQLARNLAITCFHCFAKQLLADP